MDVKYVVNTTEAHVYVTTVLAHGGMQFCYTNEEMTEGIQMFHQVKRFLMFVGDTSQS